MARTPGAATRLYRRQPRARDRIWFAIRVMRRFDIPSLEAAAEAGRSNTQKYVFALTRAGFLRKVFDGESGKKGGHAVWMLVRDPGPMAPRLQRDGRTYDPNGHEVFEGGLRQ